MKRLMGGILLGAGLLIAGTSGLCSAYFLISLTISAIMSNAPGGESLAFLGLVLLFGGIPFGIGFGLVQWGRSLLRESEQG